MVILWLHPTCTVLSSARAWQRRKPSGQRGFAGLAVHNTNRHDTINGPAITVPPLQAKFADPRPSCRDAVLDAIARLQMRTGSTEFARRDIVAEVRAGGAGFERQTIYRCLRRMIGHEPGSAYHDLEDLNNDRLRLRP
jgi:hypothetical protein